MSGLCDDLLGDFTVFRDGVESGVSVDLCASSPSGVVVSVVVEESSFHVCGKFVYASFFYVPQSMFNLLADAFTFCEAC